MTDIESQKVIIVGAGPAGAALAQILRKNQIPYEIFERETVMNERRGAGFLIDGGLEALSKQLPDDLGDPRVASANHSIGEMDISAFIDGNTGTIVARQRPVPFGQPGFGMVARRDDFRNWMTQHLPVQTGKRVVRYEEDFEGVTVHFMDGTSTRGAMLVAADGASSVIRKQLLADPPKELNSHVPIVGEVELPRHAYEPLLQAGNGAVITNSDDVNCSMMRIDIKPDGSSARYWWVVAFVSPDPKADTAWVMAASRSTLHKRAMEATSHMPQIIRDVIRRTPEAGIWQPQIRFTEWIPPSALPRGRVTLLGDAAHNTTPFGGQGANTGLKDAADLARLIKTHVDKFGSIRDRGDVDWILKCYEDIMLPRGRQLVEHSRAVAEAGSKYGKMAGKGHLGLEIVNEPLVDTFSMPPSPPTRALADRILFNGGNDKPIAAVEVTATAIEVAPLAV